MTALFDLYEKALYSTLTGDSNITGLVGTRVFDTQAPAGTAYPMIIFQFTSGSDDNDHPVRSMEATYRIECIALDRATAVKGQGYIDNALHFTILTIGGGFGNWQTQSEALFNLVENVEGKQFFRKGAFYKIAISQ